MNVQDIAIDTLKPNRQNVHTHSKKQSTGLHCRYPPNQVDSNCGPDSQNDALWNNSTLQWPLYTRQRTFFAPLLRPLAARTGHQGLCSELHLTLIGRSRAVARPHRQKTAVNPG
jgi:hypothetical protein